MTYLSFFNALFQSCFGSLLFQSCTNNKAPRMVIPNKKLSRLEEKSIFSTRPYLFHLFFRMLPLPSSINQALIWWSGWNLRLRVASSHTENNMMYLYISSHILKEQNSHPLSRIKKNRCLTPENSYFTLYALYRDTMSSC